MFKLISSSVIFFLITTPSFAYLGPGVGGGVIAATIGIIVAIFAAYKIEICRKDIVVNPLKILV